MRSLALLLLLGLPTLMISTGCKKSCGTGPLDTTDAAPAVAAALKEVASKGTVCSGGAPIVRSGSYTEVFVELNAQMEANGWERATNDLPSGGSIVASFRPKDPKQKGTATITVSSSENGGCDFGDVCVSPMFMTPGK